MSDADVREVTLTIPEELAEGLEEVWDRKQERLREDKRGPDGGWDSEQLSEPSETSLDQKLGNLLIEAHKGQRPVDEAIRTLRYSDE